MGPHSMTSTFGGLIFLFAHLLNAAEAHEHHMDDIPEGQGVSAEPLVRQPHGD